MTTLTGYNWRWNVNISKRAIKPIKTDGIWLFGTAWNRCKTRNVLVDC